MKKIHLKRIYEPYESVDGYRILVDRLWPRGIKKEAAHLTEWCKEVAPSNEIRKKFCHDVELFEEFRRSYLQELRDEEAKSQKVDEICKLALEDRVTLLYAAKDPLHNNAVVLEEEISCRLEQSKDGN